MNDQIFDGVTGNQVSWCLLGIPAILAWFAIFLSWLIAPHLSEEPVAALWAIYAVGGWFAMWVVIIGGWFGMFLLAASF